MSARSRTATSTRVGRRSSACPTRSRRSRNRRPAAQTAATAAPRPMSPDSSRGSRPARPSARSPSSSDPPSGDRRRRHYLRGLRPRRHLRTPPGRGRRDRPRALVVEPGTLRARTRPAGTRRRARWRRRRRVAHHLIVGASGKVIAEHRSLMVTAIQQSHQRDGNATTIPNAVRAVSSSRRRLRRVAGASLQPSLDPVQQSHLPMVDETSSPDSKPYLRYLLRL